MATDLGMVGDGDDVDLLEAVEAAFGVTFTDEEASRCTTVGDLHAALLAKMSHADRGPMSCMAACAFRRLRRATQGPRPSGPMRPSDPVGGIVDPKRIKESWRSLMAESGLRLPASSIGKRAFWQLASLTLAPLAAYPLVGHLSLAAVAVAALLATVLARRLPHELPVEAPAESSLGDLARLAAAMNFSTLAAQCGGARTRDVWPALEVLIRGELSWKGPLGPETRFFRK